MKKNFLYQSFWQILTIILPLITSPILSRVLGADGIGTYAYLSAIEGYFSIVADLGVYRYGVREIAKVKDDQENINKIFSEIWIVHTIIFLVVTLFYLIYIFGFSKYQHYMLLFFLMYIGDYLKINWLYTGIENFKKITIIDSIIKLFSFFGIVFFINSKSDLALYIILMSCSSFISSIIYWVLSPKYVKFTKVKFSSALKHFKGIVILFIPVLMENIYTNMDKVMLGLLSTSSEIGFYDNATKALISNRVIYAISLVITPKMVGLARDKSADEINKLMFRCVEISMILSCAFAFGTASVSTPFSILFWGEEFTPCILLIKVLVISMPAMALSRIIREGFLITTDQDDKYLFSSFFGAFSNFVLNALLIPKYSALGASIATVVSEYVVLVAQIFIVKKQVNFTAMIKSQYIYVIFGMIMLGINLLVQNFWTGSSFLLLMIQVAVGVVVYSSLCLIYWKKTGNEYYLGLIKNTLRKKKG